MITENFHDLENKWAFQFKTGEAFEVIHALIVSFLKENLQI